MDIDEDLARFPASIEDALLVSDTPEVPDAPEVRVRPRSSTIGMESNPRDVRPEPVDAPLYFQCPACRSTLCAPAERLAEPAPAPCGHCSTMIMPPVLFEAEKEPEEPSRRTRFASGSLISPK